MERPRERLALAGKALETLKELAGLGAPSAVERDAAVQRFEYTFEAVWKLAQRYLRIQEGIETGSPKASIRRSRDVGLLSDAEAEAEAALAMADDRNQTVHTYNEALAAAIFGRLSDHRRVLETWHGNIAQRLSGR